MDVNVKPKTRLGVLFSRFCMRMQLVSVPAQEPVAPPAPTPAPTPAPPALPEIETWHGADHKMVILLTDETNAHWWCTYVPQFFSTESCNRGSREGILFDCN